MSRGDGSGEELVDRLSVVGRGPAMGDSPVLDVMYRCRSIVKGLPVPGGVSTDQGYQMLVFGHNVV